MSEASTPQPGDWLRRRRGPTYQKGAEGERRFGARLNAAADARGGCWVLHGLVLPGKHADIDHLVIGPSGVTVIDAKAWEGRAWQGRLGLGRGRKVFPRVTEGVRHQINRVHSLLAHEGRDDVPVTGLVCMVNENEGIPKRGFATVDGIDVGHPRAVIRRALRDGPVDLATLEKVHRLLSSSFVVNGGSWAPTAPRRAVRPGIGVRRGLRLTLGAMLLVVIAAALISAVPGSVHRLAEPYRSFSRADLNALLPEMRATAIRRAHGRLAGLRITSSAASFVVTYRRGKHCRVRQTVARAAHAFGGGRYSTVVTGCGRG